MVRGEPAALPSTPFARHSSGRRSFASPAASDMSPTLCLDPRPSPRALTLLCSLNTTASVILLSRWFAGAGICPPDRQAFMVV
jgi:hypothetical protein